MRRAFGLEEAGIDWDELLQKRRVVILAEAGSGKSTEMAERARIIDSRGCYGFPASLEDVGHDVSFAINKPSRRACICQHMRGRIHSARAVFN